ncbi:MAG: threonine synthase [Bacteroidales bacterium]|nr:threonine synthase [Bacteroidales bacterium]
MNNSYYYKCVDCGKEYPAKEIKYLCEYCEKQNTKMLPPKGVLHTLYDYNKIANKLSVNSSKSFQKIKENHFLDILPINNPENFPNLKVGNTPLYRINSLDKKNFDFELFLKDDSQNPTYSFKDRASYLVSAYAKENNIDTLVAASTGNAGSSLAGICASQKQKAIILVPEKAPIAKLTQILMYGAKLVPVKGNYDTAFDLSVQASKKFGWYNRNTAFNPLTIEGKKTVAFELFEQLNYFVPDRIFIPVGDGVIISGVYKGFEDLMKLKIIEKMPVIIAVQSSGSNNLVGNIDKEHFKMKQSATMADSISVDIPRNFHMAKNYLNKYKGLYLTVDDEEILSASASLSKNTGLFAEPAAAAAFAGFLHYYKNNKLDPKSKNIVLLTGSGLKDLQAVQTVIKMPVAIEPDIKNLELSRII